MLHQKIKGQLKQTAFIYNINAEIKAFQLAHASKRLRETYERLSNELDIKYSKEMVFKKLKQGLSVRGITVEKLNKGKLCIYWVGANWHQDNSGLLAALSKFAEVHCFHNIYGEYGLLFNKKNEPIRIYNPDIIQKNDDCLIKQIKSVMNRRQIHVLIGQMWSNYISADALNDVQHKGIITINISMDDRLPIHWGKSHGHRLGSVGLCKGLDLILTTAPECCLRYTVEGCPSLFWPLASDPDRFYPFPEKKKEYDVTFIGNKYGIRKEIINSLVKAGIKVQAYGIGWPNGPADADKTAEIFAKSRIILGVGTIGYNRDIFTLKLRDFDATMAGALYITHRNPDLLTLFKEGDEIECYLSVEECIRKIRYYLENQEKRISVAKAGAMKARKDHTWEKRFSDLFSTLGLLIDHS